MRSFAVLTGAVLTALSVTSADATVRIKGDPGGLMSDYASRFTNLRQNGESVVIDGPGFSACTMVLGYLPRDRVGVTNNAILGFHAALQYDPAVQCLTSRGGT